MTSAERDTTLLAGGGEMGALMRAHDWKATPLGDPAGWPQSLRTAVRLLLNCGHPVYVWWGPNLICFCNDAYRRSIGPERHPSSLGQPGRAVWAEIWPIIGPQIEQAMSGRGATWHENHLVPITRNGRREDVYWTYSYSPIDDAAALHGAGGVLVVCSETTEKVLTEQRLMAEIERQRRMLQKAPGFIAVLSGPGHVYEYVNEAYLAIAGQRDFIGRSVREALPELEGQGFYELLDRVYGTGERFIARATAIDISARKLAEARHAFMLELSDALRGNDTDKALNQACVLMGRFFGVSRVDSGHLDPVEDVFDYSVCWTDGRAQPLLGSIPAHAFGKKIVAKLGAGETVVMGDLQTDPLSDEAETRATARAVDTRSILVVPFVRAGPRTIVYLNDRPVRRWQPDEVAFMEEVAERTRQVIERGEAEAALRALDATLEARVEARTAELRVTEDALRQAQKMEAIGQLTGGIAHDFNNLLQGITGSLDLVQRRNGQVRRGDLDRFITSAMASANRAAALTHRLLAFARRQPLDPHPVQVNPLVGSMEERPRRTFSERIDLELKLADGLWLTRCDANQLESAILNFAINARDARPEGGPLVIGTHNRDGGRGRKFAFNEQNGSLFDVLHRASPRAIPRALPCGLLEGPKRRGRLRHSRAGTCRSAPFRHCRHDGRRVRL